MQLIRANAPRDHRPVLLQADISLDHNDAKKPGNGDQGCLRRWKQGENRKGIVNEIEEQLQTDDVLQVCFNKHPDATKISDTVRNVFAKKYKQQSGARWRMSREMSGNAIGT